MKKKTTKKPAAKAKAVGRTDLRFVVTDSAFVREVRAQLRRLDLEPGNTLAETLRVVTTLVTWVNDELGKPEEASAARESAPPPEPHRIVLAPEQVQAAEPSNNPQENADQFWRRVMGFAPGGKPTMLEVKMALPGALTRHPDSAHLAYRLAKMEIGEFLDGS